MKHKEEVCYASDSGSAKKDLSKTCWDCKDLTCSPKYLDGSMPQANHSSLGKSSELKIAGSCGKLMEK